MVVKVACVIRGGKGASAMSNWTRAAALLVVSTPNAVLLSPMENSSVSVKRAGKERLVR